MQDGEVWDPIARLISTLPDTIFVLQPAAAPAADSTTLIGWPSFGMRVPIASLWRVAETVTAGLIVAIVAYWLASRRLKTARWHERQGEAYGKILKELRVVAKASDDLAIAEGEDLDGGIEGVPRKFSRQDKRVIQRVRREAYNRLLALYDENRYLLSRTARRTIQAMIDGINDPENDDVHAIESVHQYHSRIAHQRFEEDLLVDVGTEVGAARLLRRLRRWGVRTWWITRSRAQGLRFRVQHKLEEWKLALTSHLTQADVRTPPRWNHWKTVEQMKKAKYSKGQIQRELRMQLRGDPGPPWEPLPPRPSRRPPSVPPAPESPPPESTN